MPTRELTEKDKEIIDHLYRLKAEFKDTHAYVTSTAPIQLKRWNGRHPYESNMKTVTVPAGRTLKIVMISRFEDFGLTDDLSADNGYEVRLPFDSDLIENLRLTP